MAVSFKDRAYQHIRSKLLLGNFVAGERLAEEALAAEIGISRTPVREALNRLASEGLAKQLPRYGVFVRSLKREELAELYDLRALLESYAAEQAAENRTRAQMDALWACCEIQRRTTRAFRENPSTPLLPELHANQREADLKFHSLILEAASRPHVLKVASNLRLLTQLCGRTEFMPGEDVLHVLSRTLREHVAIVRTLEAGDRQGAGHWMRLHLQRGRREGLAALDVGEIPPAIGKAPADAVGEHSFNHVQIISKSPRTARHTGKRRETDPLPARKGTS